MNVFYKSARRKKKKNTHTGESTCWQKNLQDCVRDMLTLLWNGFRYTVGESGFQPEKKWNMKEVKQKLQFLCVAQAFTSILLQPPDVKGVNHRAQFKLILDV